MLLTILSIVFVILLILLGFAATNYPGMHAGLLTTAGVYMILMGSPSIIALGFGVIALGIINSIVKTAMAVTMPKKPKMPNFSAGGDDKQTGQYL